MKGAVKYGEHVAVKKPKKRKGKKQRVSNMGKPKREAFAFSGIMGK